VGDLRNEGGIVITGRAKREKGGGLGTSSRELGTRRKLDRDRRTWRSQFVRKRMKLQKAIKRGRVLGLKRGERQITGQKRGGGGALTHHGKKTKPSEVIFPLFGVKRGGEESPA